MRRNNHHLQNLKATSWLILCTFLIGCFSPAKVASRKAPPRSVTNRIEADNRIYKEAILAWKEHRDFATAERKFTQAMLSEPRDPGFQYEFAKVLDEVGQSKRAHDLYKQALVPRSDRISSYEDNPEHLVRFAVCCEKIGAHEDAVWAYRKVLALPRGHAIGSEQPDVRSIPPGKNVLAAQAHVMAAIRYYSHADRLHSIRETRIAVNLLPKSPVTRYYLAFCLRHNGQFQEAFETYMKAKSLATNDKLLVKWIQRETDELGLPSRVGYPHVIIGLNYTVEVQRLLNEHPEINLTAENIKILNGNHPRVVNGKLVSDPKVENQKRSSSR